MGYKYVTALGGFKINDFLPALPLTFAAGDNPDFVTRSEDLSVLACGTANVLLAKCECFADRAAKLRQYLSSAAGIR